MMAMALAMAVAGGAVAAEKDMAKAPMMEMVKSIKADKDGMISVQQVLDMEHQRISKKMKEMGMKGDKMTPADWEKLYDQLYRGV
ncbi:MAG: hypothetical protein V4508_07370 [Pseudomonadota bacterium]